LSLWAQDLIWDLEELQFALNRLVPLGCKGTTGTQASFLILFNGDRKKVWQLDDAVCKKMGFSRAVSVSGQTLSRKVDVWFLNALANLGSSLSKMSYDLRLLQHLNEVKEPFGKAQVGSSAMAYKQNPMMAERITGLSRFLMSLSQNGMWTHATQWLERSLDDSSNRRLVLPEAFLTADALLEIAHRILAGLRVEKTEIKTRLDKYRPLFLTEEEMMVGTIKGGSRQELHEKIRKKMVQGKIKKSKSSLGKSLSGMSAEQVDRFVREILQPVLKRYAGSKKGHQFQSANL